MINVFPGTARMVFGAKQMKIPKIRAQDLAQKGQRRKRKISAIAVDVKKYLVYIMTDLREAYNLERFGDTNDYEDAYKTGALACCSNPEFMLAVGKSRSATGCSPNKGNDGDLSDKTNFEYPVPH